MGSAMPFCKRNGKAIAYDLAFQKRQEDLGEPATPKSGAAKPQKNPVYQLVGGIEVVEYPAGVIPLGKG